MISTIKSSSYEGSMLINERPYILSSGLTEPSLTYRSIRPFFFE